MDLTRNPLVLRCVRFLVAQVPSVATYLLWMLGGPSNEAPPGFATLKAGQVGDHVAMQATPEASVQLVEKGAAVRTSA